MKIAISFTGILFAVKEGLLRLGDIDKVYVGCDVDYACGDHGIPQEVTWLNRSLPHRYGVGGYDPETGISENDLEPQAREVWDLAKPFFRGLRKKGLLKRVRVTYGELAKTLFEEGHLVWVNRHWIEEGEITVSSDCYARVCTECGLYKKDCQCHAGVRNPCGVCGDTRELDPDTRRCLGCGFM